MTRTVERGVIPLGKDGEGNRAFVTIELRTEEREQETTEHTTIMEVTELSVVAHAWQRNHRDITWSCPGGDWLKYLDDPPPLARRVAEIGERWHLNAMRAGCAHQTVRYETDRYGRRVSSLTLTEPCPKTGYKYGHAWLVEPLPGDVLAEIRGWMGSTQGRPGTISG